MKTLVVSYLPRGERSHTRKVMESFLEHLPESRDLEFLDLCSDAPEMFLTDNLLAYVDRNYLDMDIGGSREALLATSDRMCRQLLEAEQLVWAFPMHNFSLPAVVKSWVDAVCQKGKTFAYSDDGYQGLLPAGRAAIIMASGGIYEGDAASMDHASTLAEQILHFLGITDVSVITAAGMNIPDGKAEDRQTAAIRKAAELAAKWT